jgi:hypothetical protein
METIEEKKEVLPPPAPVAPEKKVVEPTTEVEPVAEAPENANEILDKEEQELPEPQSPEVKLSTPVKKVNTKKCPTGCIRKTRCKGKIRGGKHSKKSKKSIKNKSKKNNKKAKKSKK